MDDVRKISKKYYLREIMACFLVSCLFFNAPVALAEVVLTANPVGTILVDPVVPAVGDYDFTQAMSASDGSIGEFSNFDIASDLWVTCTQPTTTSNALFKVDSPDGTQILGRFDATGNVYLRDGGGFFIGVDGIVNANKFVASTLVIDNVEWQAFVGDPISNKLKFGPGGADPGAVTENTGTITAPDGVYLVGPQVLNSGTINSDLVVMAAGDKVYLKHDVGSKVYIEMPSDLLTSDPTFNKVDNSGTINTAGQVLLAAGDIFSTALNAGSLAATANRDITLTGTVQTTGDIELAAARDVQIKDDVTTGGNLSIEATSGAIDAKGATIYMDDDKTLTITQNASIAMETGFTVSNSENTDLVATSTGGLFTSAAAPDWKSITASANGDVTLNDMLSGGTITAGALTSTVGNIDVRSDHGQVLATDTITAGGNVSLTGRDGIELGADVTSGGFQNYNSDVELKADVTAASTGAGNITFASKVDGGQSLTVNTAGVTKFQGEVGGTIPLSLLQTDAPGSTQINGGLVTTAGEPGDQRYYDPVTLGRNTTLNGHNVQFYSTLDSGCIIPRSLLVNADAITGFWGEVGGIAPLASLETDSPGSTWLFNADVTTTGAQTYGDPVKVGRPGGIITTRSTEGGNITFAQTVDNHHKASPPTGLNVETAGVTKFQGVVGGTEPLASLTTDAPGRTEISTGTINLNGSSATFGDPVLLMANLTINEAGTGNIEFASTVDSEEGSNHTLTVNSGAGATIFGDAVGSDA
ncbi:MAG: filamentous hemagglutinin N-terminal domain-containing protein, partial [Planctomycetota bacterium]